MKLLQSLLENLHLKPIHWTTDDDGDGFSENQGDCDDSNSQINPSAQDRAVDGFDQNCDGIDGPDLDQDGYVDLAAGGNDCNDNNANVNPGHD